MSYKVSTVLNLLVFVAALLGWIRLRTVQPSFFPFLLLLTAGFLHESLSAVLLARNHSNAVVYNVYALIEALLILWQFRRWKVITISKAWSNALCTAFVTAWLTESFYLSNIHAFSSYFIIFYSFIVVLLSVNSLNVLIVKEQGFLLKNPVFLICAGFLLYFTFSILVEAFWMYGLNRDPIFQSRIYDILVVVNLLTNVLYTLSIVWIYTKPKFILLS